MTDKEVAEEMAESVFLYKYVLFRLPPPSTRVRGLIGRPLPTLRAHRVMEVDGDMQAIPITETPFVREMLESNFTYILDCETEIFIWVGKKSDWESKASGIMLADVRLLTGSLYCLLSRRAQVAINGLGLILVPPHNVNAGLPHHVRTAFVDSDDAHA
jgi:hypothetical protein